MISVIIPCYNNKDTIANLVESLVSDPDFTRDDEVLVIDDCSSDSSPDVARAQGAKIISLEKNSGPSVARNRGVQEAKNDILFFLDSDTLLEPGAIAAVKDHFTYDQAIPCVNGWCSTVPITSGIGQEYKGLVEYSWTAELPEGKEGISCFNTRVGAIKKQIFDEVGGFNSSYRKAEVEDYEFSYRVIQKYGICLDKRIRVKHDFPGIWGTIKAYWSRSGKWVELFFKRKAFDKGGTSVGNGFGHLLGAVLPIVFILGFWESHYWWLSFLLTMAFFYTFRYFFFVVLKERGLGFLGISTLLHILYSLVIITSASLALIRQIFK